MNQINFLGIEFCETTVIRFAHFLITSKSTSIVVTPNVDHMIRFHKDKNFNQIYSQVDYCLNDSRILSLLSRILFDPLKSLVTGSDLTRFLVKNLSDNKREFAIIGNTEIDIQTLKSKFNIGSDVFHINPTYGFVNKMHEIEAITSKCLRNKHMIYLLCVGSPQQEVLAIHLKNAGVQGHFLCVGASINFLIGSEKRAPSYVQKLNLEWLYRLSKSPRRLWRRYLLVGPSIFLIAIKFKFFNKDST